MSDLNNKIAIVTGASRGIGKAIAIHLADEGCQVFGIYEKSEDLAKKLEADYSNITMIKADIGNTADIERIVKTVTKDSKGIDILVNNAGINIGGRIEDYALKDWNRMQDVNVTAKFYLTKLAIPFLRKSQDAVIINISSRGGLNDYVFAEFVPYCLNNAAINNFTVALAKELRADGIRVNAVIPTVTNTDRFKEVFTEQEQQEVTAAGKLGTTDEVAELVMWLIKDTSKTGEIVVDKRVCI